MNPDFIENRDDALALVDADLITIGDFFQLCSLKGWKPTGETEPRLAASKVERIGEAASSKPEVVSVEQDRAPSRSMGKALGRQGVGLARTVSPKPGRGLYLAFTNA